MHISNEEQKLIEKYRELKEWGYGELKVKVQDNEIMIIDLTTREKVCYNG